MESPRKKKTFLPDFNCFQKTALIWFVLLIVLARSFQAFPATNALSDQDLDFIIRQAEAGDAQAQLSYALMLDHGIIGPMDEKAAFHWYAQAARQGLPAACFYLGMKYASGVGVKRDIAEAIGWYEKAALQDWPAAQFQLGILYMDDSYRLADPVQAIAWLRLAEGNDYPTAAELRRTVEEKLTAEQLEEARHLTRTLEKQITGRVFK